MVGRAIGSPSPPTDMLGVAACGRSTCHGRQEPTGAIVRQDEIARWQDSSSPAGAHSRAWKVLAEPRARAIAARLGLGDAQRSGECLGCHASTAQAHSGGTLLGDGVGCESCHGAASRWLASHYAMGATHARNVAAGMTALEQPAVRAGVCLDCHFGSARTGQFASHRLMAAGHPRLVFELDLFSTLEQHWSEDADYRQRKRRASGVQLWAVGQAKAVERSLGLFVDPARGQAGAFPEFSFFDCQTCHRRFGEDPGYRPSAPTNPARPIPLGTPAYQDENMIMLSAAAAVAAPQAGRRFDADARDFHAALASGRPQALAAAARLRGSAAALSAALDGASFDRARTLAIIDRIATGATAERFTDYEGSVQAVMAVDTLLTSLVRDGGVSRDRAAAARPAMDRAYAAVRDANAYDPAAFRRALATAAGAIRQIA